MAKMDIIFRCVVLTMFAVFLWVFYLSAQNGRYQNKGENVVLDTRTGVVYRVTHCAWDKNLPPGCVVWTEELLGLEKK